MIFADFFIEQYVYSYLELNGKSDTIAICETLPQVPVNIIVAALKSMAECGKLNRMPVEGETGNYWYEVK